MSEKQPDSDSCFDFKSYMKEQVKEALNSVNKYFAAQKLGHEPTDEEALCHWFSHQGPENFAEQHRSKFFKTK